LHENARIELAQRQNHAKKPPEPFFPTMDAAAKPDETAIAPLLFVINL